jgi:hypothetical protein
MSASRKSPVRMPAVTIARPDVPSDLSRPCWSTTGRASPPRCTTSPGSGIAASRTSRFTPAGTPSRSSTLAGPTRDTLPAPTVRGSTCSRRPAYARRRASCWRRTRAGNAGLTNAGVEDPRTTWVPSLGRHHMTYVAFGPLGPRLAMAISTDLRSWQRLGPARFAYQSDLDTDLNLFPTRTPSSFPNPCRGPPAAPAMRSHGSRARN